MEWREPFETVPGRPQRGNQYPNMQRGNHHPQPFPSIYCPSEHTGEDAEGAEKEKRSLTAGIFNLTNVSFNEEQLLILVKGLKFALAKFLDKFEAFIDLEKFARKLNVKLFFLKNIQNKLKKPFHSPFIHTELRNKSALNPKGLSHRLIEVFKHMLQEDLKSIPYTRKRQVKQVKPFKH